METNKPEQIIKVSRSILDYFFEVMNLQNESPQYREDKIKEFINVLQSALNAGKIKNKVIQWI